jgi:hypothetical protein
VRRVRGARGDEGRPPLKTFGAYARHRTRPGPPALRPHSGCDTPARPIADPPRALDLHQISKKRSTRLIRQPSATTTASPTRPWSRSRPPPPPTKARPIPIPGESLSALGLTHPPRPSKRPGLGPLDQDHRAGRVGSLPAGNSSAAALPRQCKSPAGRGASDRDSSLRCESVQLSAGSLAFMGIHRSGGSAKCQHARGRSHHERGLVGANRRRLELVLAGVSGLELAAR